MAHIEGLIKTELSVQMSADYVPAQKMERQGALERIGLSSVELQQSNRAQLLDELLEVVIASGVTDYKRTLARRNVAM